MKQIIFTTLSLFVTAASFAQTCPTGTIYECAVAFTYDDAGNRVERKQVCACVIPAPEGRTANTNSQPIDENTLVTTDSRSKNPQIVSIAPNPTTQGVRVQFSAAVENAKLHIMDSNGKLLGTQTVSGTSAEADLSTYTAGVYFISLHTNEAVHTQKVVKM